MPIIHVIGLPGAGKTVLTERLSKALNFPVFYIGKYRAKFPQSPFGEADAWLALYRDLSRLKWDNCILETTGLNSRESFLKSTLPLGQIITIKLKASRPILYQRIKQKKKNEQGGQWLFSSDFSDKCDFVRKSFNNFSKVPADLTINTSRKTKDQIYKEVFTEINKFQNVICKSK